MFVGKMGVMDRMKMVFKKPFESMLYLSPGPESNVLVQLVGPHGHLKDERRIHNTVTTAGKYGAAAQVLDTPDLDLPGWMELGEGTGGTTKLNDYIASSRVALTSKTRTNAIVTMVGDWAADVGTGAITEIGVFDVVTEDTVNMWMYTSFSVVNKGALDTLSATWTLTFS